MSDSPPRRTTKKWKYRSKGELAMPAYYMGDLASSRKLVSEALDSASAAEDNTSVVRLLTHIGAVYVMRGSFDAGMEHLKKAEMLSVKTGNQFPATVIYLFRIVAGQLQ